MGLHSEIGKVFAKLLSADDGVFFSRPNPANLPGISHLLEREREVQREVRERGAERGRERGT